MPEATEASGQPGPRTWIDRHPELVDELIAHIKDGVPQKHACALVGMARSTYHHALGTSKQIVDKPDSELTQTERIYRGFAKRVERAEAEAIRDSVLIVRQAANVHWQAGAWFLERRAAEEFAKPPAHLIHHGLSGDELAAETRAAIAAMDQTIGAPEGAE